MTHLTHFQNVTSFTEAFGVANTMSDGFLAVGFPVVFWIAMFGFSMNYGRSHAITASSFLTAIILLIENMAGLVSYWVIVADLVLLALGLGMIFMERRAQEG